MRRLYFCLRLLVTVLGFPLILLYICAVTVAHPIESARHHFRPALRIWMCVLDWAKGIPVGYSYWEQFEAPSMLDEIAVHHDD